MRIITPNSLLINKILFIILFINFLLIPDVFAGEDVWQKAVNFSELSKTYRANKVVTFMYELEKDGSLKSETEIHQRLKSGDKIQYETFKMIKNGKQVTGKALEKVRKNDSKHSFSDDTDIFSVISQKKIQKIFLKNEIFNGINSSVFDVTYKKDEKVNYKGKVWISENTGNPLKFSFTLDPLPFGVKEINIDYIYGLNGEKYFLDKVEVEGKVKVLFFEKNFKMVSEFRDYR